MSSAALAGPSGPSLQISGTVYGDGQEVTISGTAPGATGTFYAEPLQVTANWVDGSGNVVSTQTLYAWCVDVFHEIYVPIENAYNPPGYLNYTYTPLLTDNSAAASGDGATLSSTTIAQIGALVNYGDSLIAAGTAPDLDKQVAAVQEAIWQIEYNGDTTSASSAYSFAPVDSSGATTTYFDDDIAYAEANPVPGTVYEIVPQDGRTQSFAVGDALPPMTGPTGGGATGAVPEPATWGLMLIGLGTIGAGIRLRRRERMAAQPA
jgi:hypothetical protein